MRHRLAVLVLALAAGAGCSQREHSNPFDPRNPLTGGRPIGFQAIAGDGMITLQWQTSTRPQLLGYRLSRRVEGQPDFITLFDLLPSTVGAYFDRGLANGVEHHYRLSHVFAGGVVGPAAEDAATPGTLRPWMTDLWATKLLRLTPDGRHVAFEDPGFDGPTQVDVNRATGVAWTSDTFGGRVTIYNPYTRSRIVVPNLSSPTGIAVDALDGTGWVCDEGQNAVYHFTAAGNPASPGVLGPFDLPIAVAVDPLDGAVWVCERSADQVRRFAADGTSLGRWTFARPSRVAVDSVTHGAWVTSFEGRQAARLSVTGSVLYTLAGLGGPIGVAVDSRRGRIWIADAGADQVVAVRRTDNSIEFRVGGLAEVREIAVDQATGDAWATVPGDRSVVRLEVRTGGAAVVASRLAGFTQPYAIALDPGVR